MVDLEEIQCPFCNLNDCFPIWKENGYTGNKCAKCGLIFISPRPTIQSMAELYDLEQTAGKSVQEHFTYHYSEHLHNKKILDILHKYKPNGSVLEIGPGGGHFILQAQERGYKLYAIEINKEQAEKIHSNMKIPIACGPVDDVSLFQGEQFDIIFHKDV